MKTLRWVLATTLICGMGVFTSCSKDKEVEPKKEELKNSMDYLREDYAAVIAAYPEFKGSLVEARYELIGLLSQTNPSDLKPVSADCYFYHVRMEGTEVKGFEVVELLRDFETGKVEMEKIELERFWEEDDFIPTLDNYISLEKAIECAYAVDCMKPASKFVVFRNPVNPFPAHDEPMYIFGNQDGGLLYIDAVTGKLMESSDEE
jgi:hypothetical protein